MTDETLKPLSDLVPTEERPKREALTGFLDKLKHPRADTATGGVPVPHEWVCFQAVLGGARKEDLEAAFGARKPDEQAALTASVDYRAREGTHLPPGLHIFTGQTGGGKSALVVNLARAAAKAGHPVLYVTLELDGAEIAARVLALEAGVPWYKLALRKPLSPEERGKRDTAHAVFTDPENNAAGRIAVLAPVGDFYVDTIHREAFGLWEAHDKRTPLVIFDYLQLAPILERDQGRKPLREAIGAVVTALRALSRERADKPEWPGCPVVVLSTTARSNVKGEGSVQGMDGTDPDKLRKENLETLKALPKEAGEVEATAVTAWVLALGERDENGARELTLRLVKNRLGFSGAWIPYSFHGATGALAEAPARYERAAMQDKSNGKKVVD